MRTYFYWLYPIGWMLIIFYSSSQPYEDQDMKPMLSNTIDLSFLERYLDWIVFTYHRSEVSVANLGVEGFIEFFIRKGAHVTVFFVLFYLLFLAIRKTTNISKWTTIIVSLLLTIAYASIDEFHQGLTPNRTPYIGDVLLDSFGALLASLLLVYFHYRRRNNAK
ncbi:VanZ family protein [Ornithinibacillus salinisoli]|uniref:VanZ family protein n=2 Tax=Ornithinibacillus salinisoli TaxID=1848459 RepID=A0ABW4W0V7_9BACI